jgi:serine/threonine-protein kinase
MRIVGTSPVDRGSAVGPYVLGDRIGAGGMGSVYEASGPGESVAIKVLHREWLEDDEMLRRFRDEAAAGRVVRHPNLARVLDCGETAAHVPFLVMEHVRGDALGELAHRGEISRERAVAIAIQLLDGLAALHAAGIVHGDVKTDNVIVERLADGRDRAKLIDYGLAHVMFADAGERIDDDSPISGTPEYMAPEIIAGQRPSRSTDLYGVGIVLYELLVGSTPFGGGSVSQIIHRQLEDDVIPPSLRAATGVPPILDRIVMRALAKDPEDRYPTAQAFRHALGIALPALAGLDSSLVGTDDTKHAPTLRWERPRRLARGTR